MKNSQAAIDLTVQELTERTAMLTEAVHRLYCVLMEILIREDTSVGAGLTHEDYRELLAMLDVPVRESHDS